VDSVAFGFEHFRLLGALGGYGWSYSDSRGGTASGRPERNRGWNERAKNRHRWERAGKKEGRGNLRAIKKLKEESGKFKKLNKHY